MRKFFVLLISLVLAFSIVACGDPKDDSGNGGNNDIIKPGNDYDPNDPNEYIYKDVFSKSPYKSDWDTSRNGAELKGIWDSAVLPEKFPKKPSSVTAVDRTEYVGKFDSKYSNYPPGSLYYEYEDNEKYWEYYMVMFTGTFDTFDSLIKDMKVNFECYDDRDEGMGETRFKGEFHAYSTELYIFMTYQENGSYDLDTYLFNGDGTIEFTIYAMPVLHQLPKVVEGVPLLQKGYLMEAVNYIICYDDNDDEYTELYYDYQTGKATGNVKKNWSTSEIVYYGVTIADLEKYGTQLLKIGFTNQMSEYGYYLYIKNDINVIARYDEYYKSVTVYVQVGTWY